MVFFRKLIKRYLSSEVIRFTIVGISTVLLDFICYYALVQFGYLSSVSKGLGFTIGAIYAFLANKNFTFQSENNGLLQFYLFILLYLSTLIVNVLTNETLLIFFGSTYLSFIVAFISSTTVSAILNFFGMKYIVFSQ